MYIYLILQGSHARPSLTLTTTSDTLELASHVELDEINEEEMNSRENQQERLDDNVEGDQL